MDYVKLIENANKVSITVSDDYFEAAFDIAPVNSCVVEDDSLAITGISDEVFVINGVSEYGVEYLYEDEFILTNGNRSVLFFTQ